MSDNIEPTSEGTNVQPGPEQAFLFGEVFKTEEIKTKFLAFLTTELTTARDSGTRTEYLDTLKKLEKQIQARPQTATKDWPYEGAANVCPPLTFKKGNTIYSKVLSNYSTKRPFWSVESATPDYAKHAEALGDLLNYMSKSPFHLNLKRVNRQLFWNVVFKGTQFYECAWDMQKAPVTQAGEATGTLRYKKNSPVVNLVDIEDFLTRTDWDDIQDMPFLGIRVRYSWAELKGLQALGVVQLDDLAEITEAAQFPDVAQERRDIAQLSGDMTASFDEGKYFELYKFYAFFDVDGSGNVVDVKGIIDLDSGKLLRCEINPLSYRLVGKVVYYEIPGQLYGLGVAHILEYLQDEIESLHNQRLDSLSWGMLMQFKIKSGSNAALVTKPKPGQKWVVDQMDDIQEIIPPDLSQSSYSAEEIVERYADQATGANEAMAGRADPTLKSGGGAEAQMILMQTGSSVLNTTLDTIDEYYAEIGPMLVLLLQQNASFVDAQAYIGEEKGALVQQILAMSPQELPGLFKFSIETTDLARNEGSRRQDLAAFSTLYTAYVSDITQVYGAFVTAQGQNNQFLMAFYLKCLKAKVNMMQKMTEFFHIGDPKDYVLEDADIDSLVQGGLGGGNGQLPGAAPGNVVGAGPGGLNPALNGAGGTGGLPVDQGMAPGTAGAPAGA